MADEIRSYFKVEAAELVDRLTRGASALEGTAASLGELPAMLRAAHTLKGAAQVVGEPGVARLAHDLEDVLAGYRGAPSPAGAARALEVADRIAESLKQMFAEPPPAMDEAAAVSPAPQADYSLRRTIRVDLRDSERLMTHIHESTAVAASMRELLGHRESAGGMISPEIAAYRSALRDRLDWLDREFAELHRTASRLRLVPTDALLLEAGRIARTTALSLGKQVQCQTRAEVDRLDLHVLEVLEDALLHLIRNSVAHGLELPADRRKAGKPVEGRITAELLRRGRSVLLRVSDDGRGIDVEAVRRTAIAQGTLSEAEAASASPQTLFAQILRSGFSTRARADQVSGRGVGLDAVRQGAERLGGSVAIESEPGKGSVFTLIVPETIFSTQVLALHAGGVRYALPLAAIEQTLRADRHLMTYGQSTSTLLVGRETMPFAFLTDLLPPPSTSGLPPAAEKPDRFITALVLRSDAGCAVLGVDAIEEFAETLIRPLPSLLGASPLLAGAMLGPAGEPQLLLDVAAVIAGIRATPTMQPEAGKARLPILVVDDSLTTRMLERSILEAEGYTVELATSAEQGLSMAFARTYALFLVDVEMPGMNGFEFVRTVRQDPRTSATPAIMVTSLDSPESRESGRSAGAYSYIVKGEFSQKIYLDRIRSAVGGRA